MNTETGDILAAASLAAAAAAALAASAALASARARQGVGLGLRHRLGGLKLCLRFVNLGLRLGLGFLRTLDGGGVGVRCTAGGCERLLYTLEGGVGFCLAGLCEALGLQRARRVWTEPGGSCTGLVRFLRGRFSLGSLGRGDRHQGLEALGR